MKKLIAALILASTVLAAGQGFGGYSTDLPYFSGLVDDDFLLKYPNLFVYLATDRAASITNAGNATTVANWLNVSPSHYGEQYSSLGQTILFDLPGVTAQIGSVDLNCPTCTGNGSLGQVKVLLPPAAYGTNQPITYYFVTNVTNDWDHAAPFTFGDFIDGKTGGRNIAAVDQSAKALTMYAGTSIVGAPNTFQVFNTWLVIAFVFNGASSAIYTNGVLYASGNANTQGIGQLQIGSDASDAAVLQAQLALVLAYGTPAHSGSDVAAISTYLKGRFHLP